MAERTWNTYYYAARTSCTAARYRRLWLSFAGFWVIQMIIIQRGMDTPRRFENWAAPFVLVVFVALSGWAFTAACSARWLACWSRGTG